MKIIFFRQSCLILFQKKQPVDYFDKLFFSCPWKDVIPNKAQNLKICLKDQIQKKKKEPCIQPDAERFYCSASESNMGEWYNSVKSVRQHILYLHYIRSVFSASSRIQDCTVCYKGYYMYSLVKMGNGCHLTALQHWKQVQWEKRPTAYSSACVSTYCSIFDDCVWHRYCYSSWRTWPCRCDNNSKNIRPSDCNSESKGGKCQRKCF